MIVLALIFMIMLVMKLDCTDPVTCTVAVDLPFNSVATVSWDGLDFKGQNDSLTVTGYFHLPGLKTPICHITVVNLNDFSVRSADAVCKRVYCIGGPIGYGPYGGADGTPSRHPTSDSRKVGPVYAQFFPGWTEPSAWQTPQRISAVPIWADQPGVTFTWSVPETFKRIDSGGDHPSSIQLEANGQSDGVACKLTYNFNNSDEFDPVTFQCTDDSLFQMYVLQTGSNYSGVINANIGKIGGYQPTSLDFISKSHRIRANNIVQTDFLYHLNDQTLTAMNGVSVAERWPVGFKQSAGDVWDASSTSSNLVDSFWWNAPPYNHPVSGGIPINNQIHKYFAATTSGDPNNSTGLNILTTLTKWYDDDTTNDKQ